MGEDRIQRVSLRGRVMDADRAAALIAPAATVAMSGFTGAGHPKAVPQALAQRITRAHAAGTPFKINLLTGASTAPELDGALAHANGIALRLPFQSDPEARRRINAGQMEYLDMHLSHLPQEVWFGFHNAIDVAVVEVAAIFEDGSLLPTTSVGNNKTWLDLGQRIILEVNAWQPLELLGLHDIYYGTALPPQRQPIPLIHGDGRIGQPTLRCDPGRIAAIVLTDAPDRSNRFDPVDVDCRRIAGHLVEFLRHEVARGRLPAALLPIQSGVGNIPNAVLAGLAQAGFHDLGAFTEVIQDGMLDLLEAGVLRYASATGFNFSPQAEARFRDRLGSLRNRIVLRSLGISNHPELIRRLGCICMNGMLEADIYGNVNSTHVMGSSIMNGIGGSGDFARNGFLSIFMSRSTARGGSISTLVPMVSHVDHCEHDVAVLVTEQGLADLRGLSPKQRARQIIARCAHPDYRDALRDYFDRACRDSRGKHTPHLLREALSWHQRWLETGTMRAP